MSSDGHGHRPIWTGIKAGKGKQVNYKTFQEFFSTSRSNKMNDNYGILNTLTRPLPCRIEKSPCNRDTTEVSPLCVSKNVHKNTTRRGQDAPPSKTSVHGSFSRAVAVVGE
jgi:hypothetical protein